MKKNFFAAALILSLGVGSFAACSSDDINGHQTEQKKTTTMMSIALKMPAASGQRAATDEPYNYIGEWLGQEKVNQVEVYVFEGTAGTDKLEAHQTFNAGDYSAGVVGNEVVFRPNKGIAITPGTKQVYVVVNSNTATQNHLSSVSVVGTTTLSQFETAYNGVASAVTNTGVATAAVTTDNSAAGEFAKLDKSGGSAASQWKNEIVMTGDNAGASGAVIADNVAESAAISGGSNLVALKVKRVVARVAVTSSAADFTLQGDDPYTSTVETTATLGKVTGFTYVAAQGERKLNFKQQANATDLTSNNGAQSYKWNSPAYSFVSGAGYATAADPIATAARTNYDYASLWQKATTAPANGLLGHPVPTNASVSTSIATASDANAKAIGELMEGDFLLPTTHLYHNAAPNGTDNGYYKGNTAYVLIRSIFTPEKINVDLDPTVPDNAPAGTPRPGRPSATVTPTTWSTITAANRPEILVRGANGMFYSSVFASQDPIYNGVTGQSVEIFTAVKDATNQIVGYKMLYFAWVNPDNVLTQKWYNSPVYRNNIYHIQLDGVTGTGTSWNPLVPASPTDPSTSTPNNPDQLTVPPTVNVPTTPGLVTPTTPVTPVTPTPTPTPVQPQNPLTPNKTFMAVKTTVLPWQVHGYKFNLHNQ